MERISITMRAVSGGASGLHFCDKFAARVSPFHTQPHEYLSTYLHHPFGWLAMANAISLVWQSVWFRSVGDKFALCCVDIVLSEYQ